MAVGASGHGKARAWGREVNEVPAEKGLSLRSEMVDVLDVLGNQRGRKAW